MHTPNLSNATAYECWQMARAQAELYQRLANRYEDRPLLRARYLAKRDAIDRLSQMMLFGRRRGRVKPSTTPSERHVITIGRAGAESQDDVSFFPA